MMLYPFIVDQILTRANFLLYGMFLSGVANKYKSHPEPTSLPCRTVFVLILFRERNVTLRMKVLLPKYD